MKYIEFHFPSLEESREINQVYVDTLEEYKNKGIPSKEEMEKILKENGIFTQQMEDKLYEIEHGPLFKYPIIKEIHKRDNYDKETQTYLERVMIEIISGKRKIRTKDLFIRGEKLLNEEFEEYNELNSLKNKYIKSTIEGIALHKKNLKTVFYCTYNGDTGKKLWNDYEQFLQQRNHLLYLIISVKCLEFIGGLYVSVLRRLARHPMWKTRWISATKTGQNLFDKNITEWDMNKLYLCYWSNFYDNICEMYKAPEQYVIEDDEFLDNFLEGRKLENEKEKGSSAGEGDKIVFNNRLAPRKKK